MKRDFDHWTLDVGRWTFLSGFFVCVTVLFNAATTFAFTSENNNPYTGIVERNVFGIKAPPPPPVATPPPTAATGIELRGILTLLGRPQVLLNFKVPGKPPEPPKDRSLVMDVNQREGEVEVLEINPAAGTVRIRNQGNEISMNLKDNAPKPQGVAGLAAPVMPAPAGMNPGIPQPGGVPAPAAAPGGGSPTPFGGSAVPAAGTPARPQPTLPTRNLRSSSLPTVSAPGTAVANDARALPLEAQVALIEIERERTKDAVSAGKMPPLPPITLPK